MAILDHTKRMSAERFLAIYSGLENQGYGPLDKQVAEKLRFRPVAIRRLPMAKRARQAQQILLEGGGHAELAYELFGTYLMSKHKELVTAFLDGTGVEHEDGIIESTLEDGAPDPERIEAVVAELDQRHDPDDVTLYLALCTEMWPGLELLRSLWERRVAQAPA